jgi:hypothetical protein
MGLVGKFLNGVADAWDRLMHPDQGNGVTY